MVLVAGELAQLLAPREKLFVEEVAIGRRAEAVAILHGHGAEKTAGVLSGPLAVHPAGELVANEPCEGEAVAHVEEPSLELLEPKDSG